MRSSPPPDEKRKSKRHDSHMDTLRGVIVQGYRVASGPSQDYPYGALERQSPIFKARGLDLGGYFNGTLNIDIHPNTFQLVNPEFTFYNIEWTDLHPPEHFSFSQCKVIYKDIRYEGWIYYPHPETKLRNFQNPYLLEVIAQSDPRNSIWGRSASLVNSHEVAVSRR